jgi:hypothetical protein
MTTLNLQGFLGGGVGNNFSNTLPMAFPPNPPNYNFAASNNNIFTASGLTHNPVAWILANYNPYGQGPWQQAVGAGAGAGAGAAAVAGGGAGAVAGGGAGAGTVACDTHGQSGGGGRDYVPDHPPPFEPHNLLPLEPPEDFQTHMNGLSRKVAAAAGLTARSCAVTNGKRRKAGGDGTGQRLASPKKTKTTKPRTKKIESADPEVRAQEAQKQLEKLQERAKNNRQSAAKAHTNNRQMTADRIKSIETLTGQLSQRDQTIQEMKALNFKLRDCITQASKTGKSAQEVFDELHLGAGGEGVSPGAEAST